MEYFNTIMCPFLKYLKAWLLHTSGEQSGAMKLTTASRFGIIGLYTIATVLDVKETKNYDQ